MSVDLGPEEPIDLREIKKQKAAELGPSVEDARVVIAAAMPKIEDGSASAAFEAEFLKAASILKLKSLPTYQALAAELKPLAHVNMHDWKRAVSGAAKDVSTNWRRKGDARPVIVDSADLHEVVDACVDVLGDAGTLYQREGELVHIIEDKRKGPMIRPVPVDALRDQLSRHARFERPTDEGNVPLKPPIDICRAVSARGQWDGINYLRGFVDGACILDGGTVLNTDGYHPNAELFVRNGCEVSVPAYPTQEDAQAAYGLLTELLDDFEFAPENQESHRATPIAALLTILARPAINGCTPMVLFDASRHRMGKTLLAEIVCRIATGTDATPRAFPAGREGDSELNKALFAIARSGRPIVFFDNVKGRLGGQSLEMAITAGRVSSRQLGSNDAGADVDADLSVTWLATSNNASLTPDMEGRCLVARLETDNEHPEQRSGFANPSIKSHVLEHRTRYLSAALTILRAWLQSDTHYHDLELTPWGSFEEWSRIVRGAIVYAGGADPCGARESLRFADAESRSLEAVLLSWPVGMEFKSSEIAKALKTDTPLKNELGMHLVDLSSALDEWLDGTSSRSVGRKFAVYRGRVYSGRKLVGREDRKKTVWWSVVEVASSE